MNQTKFYIVPIAIDMVNGKYYTLVIKNETDDEMSLPYIYNNYKEDVELQIKECLLDYIKVNPDWLKIQLYPKIRNKDNTLEIFYYFSIPYDNITVIDENKTSLINFDLICNLDPFLCNMKYFI